MYAIVESGGRQLKVREGDTVIIDDPGLTTGEEIVFDKVLFYSDEIEDVRIGTPTVDNVSVTGIVDGSASGPKLVVMKYRKRKSSKTKTGHRQKHGQIRITTITAS